MSVPEWCVVGAEVAVLRNDWRTHSHAPQMRRVARIGKRDVVLDDDQRFNVNHNLVRHDGGTWGWSVALLAAADPVVTEARIGYARSLVIARARDVADSFARRVPMRSGAKTVALPHEVILALAPLTGVATEIRALFGEDES